MSYSAEAYQKAQIEVQRRKETAEAEYNRRKDYVAANFPEVRALQEDLSKTFSRIYALVRNNKGEDFHEQLDKIKAHNLRTQGQMRELLQAFTNDPNYLSVPYYCKACEDTGWKNGKRCECFKTLVKQFAVQEINKKGLMILHDFEEFNPDYYNFTENGVDVRSKMVGVRIYLERYAYNFTPSSASLLFFGKTGLGKTFMSSCVAKAVALRGFSVIYWPISDIMRDIENEHFGRAEGNTLDLACQADLLILDDLGSEFKSAFTESQLYNIINNRLNFNKATIVSTNYSKEELNSEYNERIVSRLTGFYMPVHFMGKDIRHQMRQA